MSTSWHDLSYLGQVRRLSEMARRVLPQFGIESHSIRLIFHGENATFRVATGQGGKDSEAYRSNTFLLRLHGRGELFESLIPGEMEWLLALKRDVNLVVPEPIRTLEGGVVAHVQSGDLYRPVTLMRWMNGRFVTDLDRSRSHSLGRLVGQMHSHAKHWERPESFRRGAWDWEGLFGETCPLDIPVKDAWARVPDEHRLTMERSAMAFRQVEEQLGKSTSTWGLIHADLHERNVLFTPKEARPIDFDDCGDGFWLYDLAVIFGSYSIEPGQYGSLEHFLSGYDENGIVEREQLLYLPQFLAARQASVYLWMVAKSAVQPSFKEYVLRHGSKMMTDAEAWLKSKPPQH